MPNLKEIGLSVRKLKGFDDALFVDFEKWRNGRYLMPAAIGFVYNPLSLNVIFVGFSCNFFIRFSLT